MGILVIAALCSLFERLQGTWQTVTGISIAILTIAVLSAMPQLGPKRQDEQQIQNLTETEAINSDEQ